MNEDIDWTALRYAAVNASKNSYSPYSKFAVGCAAMVEDGRIVSGCNVENASYGLTLCAECNMLGELFSTGGGKLVAFICVNNAEEVIMPCGRCRQLLNEHASDDFIMETPKGLASMAEVLPQAFGKDDL